MYMFPFIRMKITALTAWLVTMLMLPAVASAQGSEVWTYAECVDYARSHNISLQKMRLGEQTSELSLEEAKAQWQPSLDFSTSHSFANAPWGAGDKNSYNGQLGLNAGWTVWNGGEREKTIERSKLNTEISRLDTEDALRSIETELLQVYLNILYAREAITIQQEAARLSGAQADRMRQLMEAGRASRVDYAQLKAQYEQDLYDVVNAEGTYNIRRMELKKLLELGIDRDVELADVEVTAEQILAELPPIDESYRLALATDLKLQGLKLEEEGAAIDIDIAKATGRPNIALNAGVGTGYYAPGGAFGDQVKQSFGENIGLTLSVPIFDQKRTKTAVAKAKVQQLDAQLDAQLRHTELAQAVENWYIDTRSSQSRFRAAEQQLASALATDELTNEQFNLGLVNPVELMNAHNNLVDARKALLQAKYLALLGRKMIEYYRTSTVSL